MKSYVMGIDFGSTTAKTVILDLKRNIVAWNVAHMGAVSGEGVKASIEGALAEIGITQADIGRTVSTGYGRRMLDVADKNYTEITCHARGAVEMVPDARLVIDIGGQDSKVIAVDANGLVAQFAMNDRCAAGTGKFLEVLARAMEIKLEDMGGIALDAQKTLKISSMCATFAETEVISLLAEGNNKPDVLGAVHAAIAGPDRSRRQEGAGRDDRRRGQEQGGGPLYPAGTRNAAAFARQSADRGRARCGVVGAGRLPGGAQDRTGAARRRSTRAADGK